MRSLPARRASHAMLRRAQIARRRGLQHFAEIHDVRAVLRRRVDELVADLHLQSADVVLQHERHEPRVMVHADALTSVARFVRARVLRGIANDLQMWIAARQHARVEVLERLAEPERERAQHATPTPSIARIQSSTAARIAGKRAGHWFGPRSRSHGGSAGGRRLRGSSTPRSSCSRQSRAPLRELAAEHGVAAKMRRARDRERTPFRLREREELARGAHDRGVELRPARRDRDK